MNQEITHDIEVAVQSFYLDNESDPEKKLRYLYVKLWYGW